MLEFQIHGSSQWANFMAMVKEVGLILEESAARKDFWVV